ncbi:hypothetical protein F2Q70_00020852, partial [Brassica cretica]
TMKNGKQPEKGSSRILSLTVLFIALCGFSFYLGGMFCSERDKIEAKDVTSTSTKVVASPKEPTVSPLQIKSVSFPECGSELQDYTPCTDPKRWKRYGVHRLSFLERHCPPVHEKSECLIPPPDGYKPPIRWPKSRDQCWYKNVPYDWINKQKSNQHWLKKEGDKFHFPGGGTMFPRGVSHYVDQMQDLIPEMKDGTVRTAIDTGCGVASWGGDLLDRGILTISLAPRDNHEAQVQFALERGIPAILGIISTQRLPFPSNSFDMAHCSRCLIPWTEFGVSIQAARPGPNLLSPCEMKYVLLEMDRILRPGGYVIMRESSYFMDALTTLGKGMRWSCRREETEYAVESEKILVCQKKLWFSSNQTS